MRRGACQCQAATHHDLKGGHLYAPSAQTLQMSTMLCFTVLPFVMRCLRRAAVMVVCRRRVVCVQTAGCIPAVHMTDSDCTMPVLQ